MRWSSVSKVYSGQARWRDSPKPMFLPSTADDHARTAAARLAHPNQARMIDGVFADFFERFPGARSTFELQLADELYEPDQIGLFYSTWRARLVISLRVPIATGHTSTSSLRRWVRANAAHEGVHLLDLIDTRLRGGREHIKAMVAEIVGMPAPISLELDPGFQNVLRRQISKYGATCWMELIPEAVAEEWTGGRSTEIGRALANYYESEYGGIKAGRKFQRALAKSGDYDVRLPGDGYGHVYSDTFGGVALDCNAFIRTTKGTFRTDEGRLYGVADPLSDFDDDFRGAIHQINFGEPILTREGSGEIRAEAGLVSEVLHVLDATEVETWPDGIRPWIDAGADVPGFVTSYERSRFEAHRGSRPLPEGARYVQTRTNSIAIAVTGRGRRVSLRQLAKAAAPGSSIMVQDCGGSRLLLSRKRAVIMTQDTRGLHAAEVKYNERAIPRDSVTIGNSLQYVDLGHGRVMHLDGVRRVETSPFPYILSGADRDELCSGKALLDNTEHLMAKALSAVDNSPLVAMEHALTPGHPGNFGKTSIAAHETLS